MNRKKGFTLIELVVVMAIIAVLSLLIIAAIQAARRASIQSQNRGNARTIEVAMEAYASRNNGQYPTNVQGLTFQGAADGPLSSYITDFRAGACENGGGVITSASTSSFTLTISDSNTGCTGTLDTITH